MFELLFAIMLHIVIYSCYWTVKYEYRILLPTEESKHNRINCYLFVVVHLLKIVPHCYLLYYRPTRQWYLLKLTHCYILKIACSLIHCYLLNACSMHIIIHLLLFTEDKHISNIYWWWYIHITFYWRYWVYIINTLLSTEVLILLI